MLGFLKQNRTKLDLENVKVEAKLYFQEAELNSKVFFRVIPQRSRYRFKEHEFIEVYVNDIFITRGREHALKIYNTICTDITEIKIKPKPYILVKHENEIIYTIKMLTSGEFVLFMGNSKTLFFVTNSLETIRKTIPTTDYDYQYLINGKESYTNLNNALELFSEN